MIWRLAALFGGRFLNTSLFEQYIHVGKYLFCMCNSPMLWISKCICHGHPWHWFHLWYLLKCSWQSELYLLLHLLQGYMHSKHKNVLCVGTIVDIVSEDSTIWFQIFNGFSLFFLFRFWVDSLIWYSYLQISLCQLRSCEALHLKWTLLLLIFGTNLRLHDPLVFCWGMSDYERFAIFQSILPRTKQIFWLTLSHIGGSLSLFILIILTRLSISKIAIYNFGIWLLFLKVRTRLNAG